MSQRKLIAERRFATAREFTMALIAMGTTGEGQIGLAYIKTFTDDEGFNPYAGMVRLWEETLTDGSKVYELHIL